MPTRPAPSWSVPPPRSAEWTLDEIKAGNVLATHSLNGILSEGGRGCAVTFGRIGDDPSLVDVVTAHESCSRIHARIAFDSSGSPWLRDLGSGNGTFVNEKRLPPEACGKEMEGNAANQKGGRGVMLYPGDAVKFGASTRIYLLEGPEEYERGAIKLRKKQREEAREAGVELNGGEKQHPQQAAGEDDPAHEEEGGCGWGMADEAEEGDAKPKVDTSTLPSMETFFSSFSSDAKYKVSSGLQQLYNQFQSRQHKLAAIQLESSRILAKQDMGQELTEGQQNQLTKNREKISKLEEAVSSLKDQIEDGMYQAVHGKSRAKKRSAHKFSRDDDVDDFYDRTSTAGQVDSGEAEDEDSLVQKWKTTLADWKTRQPALVRAKRQVELLKNQIDAVEDEEDAFFLKNDLDLARDNYDKSSQLSKEMEEELSSTERLLAIVNPKLKWNREEGLIGPDIEDELASRQREREEEEKKKTDASGDLSMPPPPVMQTRQGDMMMPPPPPVRDTAMPPPPPAVPSNEQTTVEESLPTAQSESNVSTMPPPPSVATTKRALGPSRPPTQDVSGDPPASPPRINEASDEPPRKKRQLGPSRPPVAALGTLAALRRAADPSFGEASEARCDGSGEGSRRSSKTKEGDSRQKSQVSGAPSFDARKDEWKAPKGQDGSGRTALNKKFEGRY